MELITYVCSYYSSDNVRNGTKVAKHLNYICDGIDNYVCSYYCFDNVNIEWDKGSRAFKLYM